MLRASGNFLLGEGEWERIITESGPVLGTGYIALRCSALFMVLGAALGAYQRNNTLPLLLAGVSSTDLLTGPFGQPTALGLAVFTAGLALAAATGSRDGSPTAHATPSPPSSAIRGRSRYAERLHGSGESNDRR